MDENNSVHSCRYYYNVKYHDDIPTVTDLTVV